MPSPSREESREDSQHHATMAPDETLPRMTTCDEDDMEFITARSIPNPHRDRLFPPIQSEKPKRKHRGRRHKSKLGTTLPKLVDRTGYSDFSSPNASPVYEKLSYSVRINSSNHRPFPSTGSYSVPVFHGVTPYDRRSWDKSRAVRSLNNVNKTDRTAEYVREHGGRVVPVDRTANTSTTSSPVEYNLPYLKDKLRQGFRVPLVAIKPRAFRKSDSYPGTDVRITDHLNYDVTMTSNKQPLLGDTSGPLIGLPGERHLVHVGLVKQNNVGGITATLSPGGDVSARIHRPE